MDGATRAAALRVIREWQRYGPGLVAGPLADALDDLREALEGEADAAELAEDERELGVP